MSASLYWQGVGARLRRRALAGLAFAPLFWLFEEGRSAYVGDYFFNLRSVAFNTPLMLAALIAPVLAEASALGSRWRLVAVVASTLCATAGVALALATVSRLTGATLSVGVDLGLVFSTDAFLLREWWMYSLVGVMFNVYCQVREREVAAIRAMRTAELARLDARRDVVEMRLRVLQARVEPNLLFGALADVRAVYERAPAAAEELLDDLIAYLRAALPQMRGGASTVRGEARLAAAYLRVLPAGREGALQANVAIDDTVGDAGFPPMVLLPLAHVAADAGATVIAVRAVAPSAHDTTTLLHLQIEAALTVVPEGWSQEALQPMRATLAQWFGDAADLDASLTHGVACVDITWPAWRPGDTARQASRQDPGVPASVTP